MNQFPDEFYMQTLNRVRALTPDQWARVQQRIRSVKAVIPRRLYLMAVNSVIDLELSSNAPAPEPCPQYPIVKADGAPAPAPCAPEQPIIGPHYDRTI